MNFELTDIQTQIKELTQKFSRSELLPIVEKDEENEHFRPELIQKLGELGLTGIPVDEKYGGAGLGYQEFLGVIEELAKVSASYAISVAVTGLPQMIISTYGTEEQKKKWIPPLASGNAIGGFSLSEASSGSDAASLRTTAKKKGSEYLLNGTKLWCTQADTAKTIIVMARTGEKGPQGISAFILDTTTGGFRCGKREKKMGLHSSHTYEIVLEDVKIPEKNRLGQEGEGFKIAMTALDNGRLTISATAIGIAESALNCALNHAKEREQFGKPIASHQGVSFMLADMATQLSAARLLAQKAAYLRDQNKPFTLEASQSKLFSTDMAMKVTTDAVQILGGSGYTREFPVERYMREAKVLQIVEGTNQIQRLVIGRHLTAQEKRRNE